MTDATFRRFAAATLTRARAYVSEHMEEYERWRETNEKATDERVPEPSVHGSA